MMDPDDNNPDPPSMIETTNGSMTSDDTHKAKKRKTTALSGKEGVCMIEVVSVEWLWKKPWQRCKQHRRAGSGFVFEGRRIITNAHVVISAIDIRVRKHGSPRRFPAHVLVYAPDVDLAVLEINAEQADEFFVGKHLELSLAQDLPALQESVHVVGFPTGGRTICVTEGVVSRIDNISLASTGCTGDTTLAIQIDAAINAGSSGGPVFNTAGQVTGVAFCKHTRRSTDNVGYVIPADIVRNFLGRISPDGKYTLSPRVPYHWHGLENKSLRLAYNVPDDVNGILLTDVSPTVPSLQKDDVLIRIDDSDISNGGQVVLRGDELIGHRYLLRGKRIDEPTVFTVFRDGARIELPPVILKDVPKICPRWANVDFPPDYLILGALVLVPLSQGLILQKSANSRLIGTVKTWTEKWPGEQWEGKTGLVALTDIFAHELSFAYHRKWRRVTTYNGIEITSLTHLRDLWEASCAEAKKPDAPMLFARLELEHDKGIVFEVKAAMAAQSEIMETHQIAKPSVISKPNPKYNFS